jgi:hypothetical protein
LADLYSSKKTIPYKYSISQWLAISYNIGTYFIALL